MEGMEADMQRVKLRLYYGGAFQKVPESGEWRYVGGEVYNDAVPTAYKYGDVAKRLNDKFSDPVSFKYLCPGEELDPDSLVAVTDDDDLQELYDEYFGALQRPGTPLKTFRIRVYVFPALIFETTYEPQETEEMEASMGGQEGAQDGINFESWCSEDLSFSSNPSCNPSSDTEVQLMLQQQAAAERLRLQHLMQLQQHAAQQVANHQQLGAAQQAAGLGVLPGGAIMPPAAWLPRLETHALHNITRSVHLRHFSSTGAGDRSSAGAMLAPLGMRPHVHHARGFTAEDFDLDDPYAEGGEELGRPGSRPVVLLPRLSEREEAQQQDGMQLQEQQDRRGAAWHVETEERWKRDKGEPLFNRPLDRVRDAAGGLPSHISAFGDSSRGSGGGSPAPRTSQPGSVRLPSHISAFGEGLDDGMPPDGVEACAAERLQMQRLYGGVRPVALPDDSALMGDMGGKGQCITQEFGARSNSMLGGGAHGFDFYPKGNGGGGNDGHGGNDGACPTPKLLLDSVPHVPREAVNITLKIGEGAFGEVSRAEVFPYGSVAIKWLKRDRFAKYSESFQREAEVLARLNHPNIIRMYGLVTEPIGGDGPPSSGSLASQQQQGGGGAGSHGSLPGGQQQIIAGIMMEYVRGGSLAQRFRAAAQHGWQLSLRDRCRIALQAALGMSYLHDQSPAVIHFDLKPDNLLVDGEGEDLLIKVADFGLSKHKFNNYVTCHDLRGTLPYMAPELVANPTKVCEKCDVWSMGVVMWEMVTLEVPFQELSAQQILMGLMNGSLHLNTPSSCEPEWRGLIEACMETNPQARPTFKQLADSLLRLARSLPPPSSAAAPSTAQQQSVGRQGVAGVGVPGQGTPLMQAPPPPQPGAALQAVAAAQQQAQQQAAAAAVGVQPPHMPPFPQAMLAVAAQQQAQAQASAAAAAAQALRQQQQLVAAAFMQQQHAPPMPLQLAPVQMAVLPMFK